MSGFSAIPVLSENYGYGIGENLTIGPGSIVIGNDSSAAENNCVVIGSGLSAAYGGQCIVIGAGAVGGNALAPGVNDNAVAIGDEALAEGDNSIAIGSFSSVAATANRAIAIGDGASASGVDSIALGNNTSTAGVAEVQVGRLHILATGQLCTPTHTGVDQTAVGLFMGTGAPSAGNGRNGDLYLRSDGGALTTIYQKRAGAWVGIV